MTNIAPTTNPQAKTVKIFLHTNKPPGSLTLNIEKQHYEIASIINKQREETLVEILNIYWKETGETIRIFPNTQIKLNEIFKSYSPYDMLNLIENLDNQYCTLDRWGMLEGFLASADNPRELVDEYRNELLKIAAYYTSCYASKNLKREINKILEEDKTK